MRNINVKLNDRSIQIPKALPETLKRMKEIGALRDELITGAEQEKRRYNPDDIEGSPYCCSFKMRQILNEYEYKYGEKLGEELDNHWIVLSAPNDYISKYDTACREAEKKICNRYKSYREMRDLGIRVAEEQAAKEIKGMGFGVITNSLSSALLYTGMSAITYASQAKKAQDVYDRNLSVYTRGAGEQPASYELRIMNQEVFPLIYPVAEKTAALFLDYIMKQIDDNIHIGYESLDELHKTSALVKYDGYIYGDTLALRNAMKKIQDMGSKKTDYDALLNIIEECPYCPEIYEKIINLGIFEKGVFEIAKLVGIDNLILPKLQEYIRVHKEDVKSSVQAIKIIAMYKSQSPDEAIKQQYKSEISKIKGAYAELSQTCDIPQKIGLWIYKNISSDMDYIAVISDDKAKELFFEKMQQVVTQDGFSEFSEIGLITLDDIRLSGSSKTTLTEIVDEYAEKMLPSIVDYLVLVRKKKAEYEKAYEDFGAEVERRKDVLLGKKEELNQQGVFAFSKKKNLKMEIEQLEKRLEEYRTNNEPKKVKDAYYKMYSY